MLERRSVQPSSASHLISGRTCEVADRPTLTVLSHTRSLALSCPEVARHLAVTALAAPWGVTAPDSVSPRHPCRLHSPSPATDLRAAVAVSRQERHAAASKQLLEDGVKRERIQGSCQREAGVSQEDTPGPEGKPRQKRGRSRSQLLQVPRPQILLSECWHRVCAQPLRSLSSARPGRTGAKPPLGMPASKRCLCLCSLLMHSPAGAR